MYSYFNGTATNLNNAKIFTVEPIDDIEWGIFVINWDNETLPLGFYDSEDSANYAFNALLEALEKPIYDMMTDDDYTNFIDKVTREAEIRRSRDEFIKNAREEVERLFM